MLIHLRSPYALVLMPFALEYNDVYTGIRDICDELGITCQRVDEQHHDQMIIERIYSEIRSADIVIADMSGGNPNVYYEAGYARAVKEETRRGGRETELTIVLITRDEAIPFDLGQYPHIKYGGDLEKLQRELREKLKSYRDTSQRIALGSSAAQFHLMNKRSKKFLDLASASTADGAAIQQWSFHGDENQCWAFLPVKGNWYRIVSLASGKCLSVAEHSRISGAKIVQWEYQGAESQQWQLKKLKDGSYNIVSRLSDMCLAIEPETAADGAAVLQYSCVNSDRQKWWMMIAATIE